MMDEILTKFQKGEITLEDAKAFLLNASFDDLGYAVVDNQRKARCGYHEIVFGTGKTAEQIIGIVGNLQERNIQRILVTRVDESKFEAIKASIPDMEYRAEARLALLEREKAEPLEGKVLVITAGTSDIPIAEEAALTAAFHGLDVQRMYDVGVAGIHRLLSRLREIREADVIIVIAGMEGALASVVGGLTSKPLIAVPTSVGYGANLQGLSALLSMLNSCADGVGVVNIDNGFGAAMLAYSIVRLCCEKKSED